MKPFIIPLGILVLFAFIIFTPSNNTPQAAAIATLPPFTFKQSTLQVTEGQSARITVVAPSNLTKTTRVTYTITPQGGAVVNRDYRLPSTRTLTFYKGGLKEKTITVPTISDSVTESNEAFLVRLTGVSGASIQVGIVERGGATPTPTPGSGVASSTSTFPGIPDSVAFGKVLPPPQPIPAGCKVPPSDLTYTNTFTNNGVGFDTSGGAQIFELPNASSDPRFKFVDVKDLYAGANRKKEQSAQQTNARLVDEWPSDYDFMTGTNAAGQKLDRRLSTFGDEQNVGVFYSAAPGTYHSVRFVASPTGRPNLLVNAYQQGSMYLSSTMSTRSAPNAAFITISECPGDFDPNRMVSITKEEMQSKTDAELAKMFKDPALAKKSVEELGACGSRPAGVGGGMQLVSKGGIRDLREQAGGTNAAPACRLIPGKTYYRNTTVGTKEYGYFFEMQRIKATIANILDVPYINAYCFQSKRDAENPDYGGVCTFFTEERFN